MANVKHIPAKTETVVVEEEKFILELNREEAEYLDHLLGQQSGGTSWNLYQAFRTFRIRK
jgi:hypothetical protein